MGRVVSAAGAKFIADFEISSPEYYTKALQRPTWPGGASGPTVGVGYDLGTQSAAQITKDWADLVPAPMLAAMKRCAGVCGEKARLLLPSVRQEISITYSVALLEFESKGLPRYAAGTLAAMPNCVNLPPDCFDAIASISFNRGFNGWSMTDDRRREMLAISKAIAAGKFDAVAPLIRSMKRLWSGQPGMKGLLTRRDAEADLFERGLGRQVKATAPAPVPVPGTTADDLNAAQLASLSIWP